MLANLSLCFTPAMSYKDQLSNRDMETLRDLLSAVALAGEEAGFEVGARFAIRFLRELTY